MARTTYSDRELHDSTRIEALVSVEMDERPQYWKQHTYKTYTPQLEEMYIKQIGSLGMVPVVEERDPFPVDDFWTGNGKTFVMKKRASIFEWSKEASETDKDMIFATRAEKIAKAYDKTRCQVFDNIYNNGFDASYTGPDGVALFSTAHPLQTGAGNSANRPTTDIALDPLALQQAMQEMMRTKEHRGDPDPIAGPFDLRVPPELEFLANEIVGSTLRAETADNNTNAPIRSRIRNVYVHPYITSTTAWFLQTVNASDQGIFYWEVRPFTAETDFDIRKDCYYAAMSERYIVDFDEWRGNWGTTGA